MTPELRFAQYVEQDTTSGCWLYTGARRGRGYGAFFTAKKQTVAHRFAWEVAHGPVPAGLCVLHRCDNPPCVNPAHLFLGTRAENAADMVAKGRQAHGERNGNAKLTAADVAEIRRRVADGDRQSALARDFGVSKALVCLIVQRRKWKREAA